MSSEELAPFCLKVLQYLYNDEDTERYHHSDTVFDMVGIKDKALRSQIIDELWHQQPKLIDAQSGLHNAHLRLNKQGREFMRVKNPPDLSTINETCETLFQLHKTNQPILWTKHQYLELPKNANEARRLMERIGVIYGEIRKVFTSEVWETRLEPHLTKANSFNEAVQILEDKKTLVPTMHIEEQYNFPHTQGTAVGKVSGSQNEIKTVLAPQKKGKDWKDILKEEVTKHGVRYLFTALTFFTIGLLSGKGCNRGDHQDKNKQSNSIKTDSALTNQDTPYH